jgi:hypothetical protein
MLMRKTLTAEIDRGPVSVAVRLPEEISTIGKSKVARVSGHWYMNFYSIGSHRNINITYHAREMRRITF